MTVGYDSVEEVVIRGRETGADRDLFLVVARTDDHSRPVARTHRRLW